MSYLTYPVASGVEVLSCHRDRRQKRAKVLWAERKRIRGILALESLELEPKKVNKLVRLNADSECGKHVPFKPTLENFRSEAFRLYNLSEAGWFNHLDTEYYSACGYDDYMSDVREAQKSASVEYFRAWKALKTELTQ